MFILQWEKYLKKLENVISGKKNAGVSGHAEKLHCMIFSEEVTLCVSYILNLDISSWNYEWTM